MFLSRKKEKAVQTEELDLYPILHIADSMKHYQKKLVVNEVASLNELQEIQTAFDAVLEENKKFKRIIACYSQGSRERLFSLMSEYEIKNLCVADTWKEAENKANLGKVVLTLLNLPHGFKGDGYLFISEQDILGEKQRRKTKKVSSKDFIADVSSLSVGELVVHIEHGIGRFLGLEN